MKHWTQASPKPQQSAYRDTIGNPEKRSLRVHGLKGDLERAKIHGQTRYAKYLENELISLGEGDYTPKDTGEPPVAWDRL